MTISAYQRRRYHRKLVMELKAAVLFCALLFGAVMITDVVSKLFVAPITLEARR